MTYPSTILITCPWQSYHKHIHIVAKWKTKRWNAWIIVLCNRSYGKKATENNRKQTVNCTCSDFMLNVIIYRHTLNSLLLLLLLLLTYSCNGTVAHSTHMSLVRYATEWHAVSIIEIATTDIASGTHHQHTKTVFGKQI